MASFLPPRWSLVVPRRPTMSLALFDRVRLALTICSYFIRFSLEFTLESSTLRAFLVTSLQANCITARVVGLTYRYGRYVTWLCIPSFSEMIFYCFVYGSSNDVSETEAVRVSSWLYACYEGKDQYWELFQSLLPWYFLHFFLWFLWIDIFMFSFS